MKNWFLIITTIFLILVEASYADKIPSCESNVHERSAASSFGTIVKNIDSLPKMIYLAKSAKMYVENKKQGIRLIANQSFVKAESKISCSTPGISDNSFSIYAPTLIDLTDEKKVGNSFWQFHVSISTDKIGIWNQKTRLFRSSQDISKVLEKEGLQLLIEQLSHDEFQMTFSRDLKEDSIRLVIRFDATKSPQ